MILYTGNWAEQNTWLRCKEKHFLLNFRFMLYIKGASRGKNFNFSCIIKF